jgi:acetyl esterase
VNTNEIRPDVRAFLEIVNATPFARLGELPVDETRALAEQMRAAGAPVTHELAVVRDLEFDHSGITVRLRFYDALADRGPGPVILYYHGGGFVLGDLESHHALCVEIARSMGVPLISVDYRLAPEHPWPAAPDDAEAAARWVASRAPEALGRKVTALILAGDSAGANLAAITARALRDDPAAVPVAAQFLVYPCTVGHRETPSKRQNAEGRFLTRKALDWFLLHYAAPEGDPRFDLFAFDQAGMPPTLLVTASLDPLRDEGRAYAASLIEAGVPVVFQEAKGNIHGCFGLSAVVPSCGDDVRRALEALRTLVAC